jgi:quercetin dioxygenase-like cupin family protein
MSSERIVVGQSFENEVTGERFTFTETAATSGGERLAFDFALRAGGGVPVAHVHPVQTERFEVEAGEMTFVLAGETVVAGPGETVVVEPGVPHSFRNDGAEEARLRIEVTPALAMEEMFADVLELAAAGRLTRRGLPRNPFELAVLARAYDEEAHAAFLSRGMQRLLLAPLVAVARMLVLGRPGRLDRLAHA